MNFPTRYARHINQSEPVLDSIFERFWSDKNWSQLPNVDILETDKDFQLVTDLPGFKKDEVDVNISDGLLSIKAEHHEKEKHQDKDGSIKVLRSERKQYTFERKFSVGENIETDKVNAELEDGVLTISLPKLAAKKQESHRVRIK
jgi:HSP20 family molecular chaperone IbpA